MASYNGHPSWNAWNVSLWLNNDEPLWREMVHFVNYADNRRDAARMMLAMLHDRGIQQTPDGAPYTVTNIRRAMVGW